MVVEQEGRDCHAMDSAELCRRGGGQGDSIGVAAMNDAGKFALNYVSPHARFRGVSKALVQRLEARARTLGLGECVLETTQTALRFYERLGYIKSEQTYPLPLTGLPATVLRRVLEPLKV